MDLRHQRRNATRGLRKLAEILPAGSTERSDCAGPEPASVAEAIQPELITSMMETHLRDRRGTQPHDRNGRRTAFLRSPARHPRLIVDAARPDRHNGIKRYCRRRAVEKRTSRAM